MTEEKIKDLAVYFAERVARAFSDTNFQKDYLVSHFIEAIEKGENKTTEITKKTAVGYTIDNDEMHWTVECPGCKTTIENLGYYDSADSYECKCGCEFITERLYFDNGCYIE